ncbi:MAG TPA: T9SS type A sorting domain-containing protein, partial [Flavobacteriales bacterium]|nr:T9SS type A sorting domain-containing protein [Flavobacteriales bacterium]
MKRFLLLPALLAMFQVQAQQIEQYRYWINDDPAGVTTWSIGPATQVVLNAALALPAMSKDFNMITIQFKDTNDVYNAPVSRIFSRNTGAVTGYEYCIDDQIANRVSGTLTAGTNVNLTRNIPLCLTAGTHLFAIRFQGASGTWSVPITRQFTSAASLDTDGDGLCDALDPCPLLPNVVPGQACNDNNACTVNDVVGANCTCAGTFADADNDGTCDASDLCPGGPEPGTACNDGNAGTSGDVVGPNCLCAGALIDCLGMPGGAAVPGTPCNDNNACTTNDIYQLDCGCAGTFQDNDGDGTCDASDLCPSGPEPGTPCDDNNASTGNDVIGANCVCAGTIAAGCTQNLTLEFQTDANPGQITWEIRQQGTDALIQSGGPLAAPSGIQTVNTCVPDGCYYLRVLDAGGDGITSGGYILRTAGSPGIRLIDDRNNFTAGSVSAIATNEGFCLPLGTTSKPIFTSCDKLDWVTGDYLVCDPVTSVSSEYNGGNAATSGYEFWFFNPNGGYSFRKFRSHTVSDGFAPADASRACHIKLNNWAAASLIPANTLMNVRVRTRIAGINGQWGAACRFKIDPVRAACPLTKLNDIPGSPTFSCNATRVFGGNTYIYARPVTGANKYQFRFRIDAEGFVTVRNSNNYICQLSWNILPLQDGKTYQVDVRASKDGGLTWCIDVASPVLGPPFIPWGDMCDLTIDNTPMGGGNENMLGEGRSERSEGLLMYPNPNRGDQLYVQLDAIEDGVSSVSVDIHDPFGKRVSALTIAVNGGTINTVLDLPGDMASGIYIVNITSGGQVFTERLVIQK